MVFFYKKKSRKKKSPFLVSGGKKISNPPLRLSKILVTPHRCPFPKNLRSPPKKNPLPHPAVNIMNAALMRFNCTQSEMITMYAWVLNQWMSWEEILHDGYYRWQNSPVNWKIMDNTALLNRYTLTNVSWRLTTIYLPTFSGSNAWDFRLAIIAWFETVPASSEDFR